jgi:hypothetical protein
MKRLGSLFLQDLLLAYRSGHVFITALILVLMLALVLFLPRELKIHNELIYDASPDHLLAGYLQERGLPQSILFTEETAFREQLDRQANKVGIIFSGSLKQPHFEIITQNVISVENIGLLQTSMELALQDLRGDEVESIAVDVLRSAAPPPPFNLNLIPIMIVFEVVLLGFFIVAVMMFQEKQEGTLRAYRVAPAGAINYILSKSGLFLALSLLYGLPILLVGFGLTANYPLLILLMILSSTLMTLFSIAVAVFFRDLSEWFFVGVAVLIVNSLPMLSYAFPSLAPTWLTWIPSYPAVFATRNLLFHGAGLAEISPAILYLLILNLAAFAAALSAVHFKLLKEGR